MVRAQLTTAVGGASGAHASRRMAVVPFPLHRNPPLQVFVPCLPPTSSTGMPGKGAGSTRRYACVPLPFVGRV